MKSKKKPKISVVVAVYNTAQYFEETMTSLLRQTYKPYEIIVINDASTDNFHELAKSYETQVRIIHKKRNEGISESYNTGVQQAAGDWIAFCDGDDYWDDTKLERQVGCIEDDVGYVFCDKYVFSDDGYSELRAYPRGIENTPLRSLLKCFFASPSCVMIQKQLLEQAGRFRPDLTSSEDYDMWIRIAALQPRFTRVHQALTHKRIRRTSIQGSQTKKELIRNLLIALDANKDIFVSQLGITEKQYEQYIGYNLGFLGRSFRMPVYCFLCTTNRGLGAMYRYVQRYLLKRTETPFYEGQLF